MQIIYPNIVDILKLKDLKRQINGVYVSKRIKLAEQTYIVMHIQIIYKHNNTIHISK